MEPKVSKPCSQLPSLIHFLCQMSPSCCTLFSSPPNPLVPLLPTCAHFYRYGNGDISDGKVTLLWVEQRTVVRVPAETRGVLSPKPPELLILNERRKPFPEVKTDKAWIWTLTSTSAEIKNEWGFSVTPPYTFTVWTRKVLLYRFGDTSH